MTGDRSLRDYDLESGDDAVDRRSAGVSRAARFDHRVEGVRRQESPRASAAALPLGTIEGDKQFTVRGIMKSSGLTSAFGGNLAIMDIYAAQKMFGRGRKFDRIDLAVKDGRTIAEGASRS